MRLEQLTKTQIVLLTLLVSIVSATASAIVTVSLVSQAPPTVAATVNRIIEKTVQQIVPSATSSTTLQRVMTVVMSTNEAAPVAIAVAQKSIIRIVVKGDPDGALVARGVIVSARGTALTDAGALDPALTYEAILPDDSRVPAVQSTAASSSPTAYITLRVATTTSVLIPATLADPKKLQLGKSIVRISGSRVDTAGIGIVSALPDKNAPNVIQADIASKIPGAIIIDLSGAVIGMTTQKSLALGETFYTLINTK